MRVRHLKKSELKTIRLQLLERQNHACSICRNVLAAKDSVMDHDHDTGVVRGIVHRSCNRSEGYALQLTRFMKLTRSKFTALRNILDYWERTDSGCPDSQELLIYPEPDKTRFRLGKRATR
ncbi:MAG: hypothetical protein KAG66_23075 [Methylococcales bacterium]|nr:hypothetical protein [Methylococcales bacterium]